MQDKATEKFFSDVQKQYDDKLGFESEIQNLKSEVQKNGGVQLELNEKATALNSFSWTLYHEMNNYNVGISQTRFVTCDMPPFRRYCI